MKSATYAIAQLAKEPVPEEVKTLYPNTSNWEYGPEYILPKTIDYRLKDHVSNAVVAASQTPETIES